MAHINVDTRTISNFRNEDLIDELNTMIELELSKSVDKIDTDYVDECVEALLSLEKEENNFTAIVPLISSEKFLKRITGENKKSFKSLNIFARTAIIAAIIAGGTFTANAAVEAVTGVNVIGTVADKVEKRISQMSIFSHSTGIEDIDVGFDDDEEETTTKPTTETTTAPTTTKHEETTTALPPQTTKPTTKFQGIEDIDVGFEDDDEEETTTTTTTTTKPSTRPATTRPTTQQSTAKPIIEPDTENTNNAVFVNLRAEYDNFKFDYVYGEELTYDGLKLYAVFSDGSETEVSLSDCSYTRTIDTDKTADYTLKIIYKSSILQIEVTVRPDEFTRGSEICSNDEFDYLLTDDGAYITAYKGNNDSLILDEIDGEKLIAIGPECFAGKSIRSIHAQEVKRIYAKAFYNCSSLDSCYTPDAVFIDEYAFAGCKKLDRAIYSDKLEKLGNGAYSRTAIESVVIPEGITQIADYTFDGCAALKSVELKGKVEEIGANAFNECTALESVTGCAYIKKLGDFAFYNDELVEFDEFPQELEKIGNSSLYFCRALSIGELPQSITELNDSSFAYCSGLTKITIPNGISTIPANCFRATNATEIILPEGVVEIEEYALMSTKIKSLILPSTLRTIGTYGCYSVTLRSVYFGSDIREIGANAFYAGRSVRFYVYNSTVPMQYAIDNEIKYEIIDNTTAATD